MPDDYATVQSQAWVAVTPWLFVRSKGMLQHFSIPWVPTQRQRETRTQILFRLSHSDGPEV